MEAHSPLGATASKLRELLVADDLVVWDATPTLAVAFSAGAGRALYISKEIANGLRAAGTAEALAAVLPPEDASTLLPLLIEAGVVHQQPAGVAKSPLDEIATGRPIRFLDLVVSEGCNFACPHCIHARDVQSSDSRAINSYMSQDVARKAIDEFCDLMRSHGHDRLFVHIGSSEPLLNWTTTKFVVEYVGGINGFSEKRVTINSNLSLLTEERAEFLVRNGVIISTSLDGTRGDNDRIRVRKGGQGTYEVIVSKIQMLASLGYRMDSVSLTVTDRTIRDFDIQGYIDLLQSLGMTGVSVDFDLVGSADIPSASVAEFLIRFWDACHDAGIECYGTWTKPFENLFIDEAEAAAMPAVGFCKAVEGGNVSVSPQGNLFMCGYTSTRLGSLGGMAMEFPRLLATTLEARKHSVERHCAGCALITVCGGQCHATHEVAEAEGTAKVDRMCEIYRTVTKDLAVRRLRHELGE